MEEDFAAIRQSLFRLRDSSDIESNLAWKMHGFRTHPRLPEEEVRRFEATHRITLPADYRSFLIQVGNGGAGPYYGLFKLGETDHNWGHKPWQEGDGFIGVLAEPFPHLGPWNEPGGRPEYDPDKAEEPGGQEEFDRRMEEWDAVYFHPENVNGAIPICHLGCALRQWLVVTGPEAGHVWCDDRADFGGLYPLEHDGMPRVSFLEWYRNWLDGTVRQVREAR
jgi:hypothetical protein